jgi:hypothetical protein
VIVAIWSATSYSTSAVAMSVGFTGAFMGWFLQFPP